MHSFASSFKANITLPSPRQTLPPRPVRCPMAVSQLHVEVTDGKLSIGAERFGVEISAFRNVRSPR